MCHVDQQQCVDVARDDDGELFIESDYADEFAVSMDAVARIETDGIFEIELRDDREIAGRLATGESGTTVLITETRTVPLVIEDIEELDEPEEYFDWASRSDFSLSGSRGNTDTSDFLWQGFGSVKFGDHRHELNLRLDRKEQDGLVTKEMPTGCSKSRWQRSASARISAA